MAPALGTFSASERMPPIYASIVELNRAGQRFNRYGLDSGALQRHGKHNSWAVAHGEVRDGPSMHALVFVCALSLRNYRNEEEEEEEEEKAQRKNVKGREKT